MREGERERESERERELRPLSLPRANTPSLSRIYALSLTPPLSLTAISPSFSPSHTCFHSPLSNKNNKSSFLSAGRKKTRLVVFTRQGRMQASVRGRERRGNGCEREGRREREGVNARERGCNCAREREGVNVRSCFAMLDS